MRVYSGIGSKQIADRAAPSPAGVPIRSPADVARWVFRSVVWLPLE
jgi:hypothetical protein